MEMRVVFVCTGNTCRSPMAASVFKALVRDEPALSGVTVTVTSSGLAASVGSPAAPGAERVLGERGLSAAGHRARQFTEELATYDLILTMTESHKAEIILRYPEAAARVYTLNEYAGVPGDPDIADPFGADEDVYRVVLEEIVRAATGAVKRMVREFNDRQR